MKLKPVLLLLVLTAGAMLIQGYHPWAEDAEIYLPGVEKLLHPELFPFGSEFFQNHASLTLFPNLLAALVRTSHLPFEWVLFLAHMASLFLLLLAGWDLSGNCFRDPRARWCGVALLAAVLTLPVAGTALYIMDPYVNPRNLSAFALVLAVSRVMQRKYLQAAVFLAVGAVIHPFMAAFGVFLCALIFWMDRSPLRRHFLALGLWLPFGITFDPPPPEYHEVAILHPFHYVSRWQWYEWLGMFGPVVMLWWFSRLAHSRKLGRLELLCRALIPYTLISAVAALILSIPARFEALARIQPQRSLHLLYIIFALVSGGVLAEYVLKNSVWRWLMVFVPLCLGMWMTERLVFPTSAHIEWPGAVPRNPWVRAFFWIQKNTPVDAIFALDPFYMHTPGEGEIGFRAVAQRSVLADAAKDSGAASMFPPLAKEWHREVSAQRGFNRFKMDDFRRLRKEYGVTWLVLSQPATVPAGCPFRNEAVLICPNPAL